jgi:hypothetical protein
LLIQDLLRVAGAAAVRPRDLVVAKRQALKATSAAAGGSQATNRGFTPCRLSSCQPLGEPQPLVRCATLYSRVEVQADGPRPILADVAKASADELRAVWGPFVSEAGTYEVTPGSLITMRPIASKNPAVMGPGVFITYSYEIDGNTLSLTQQRNQNGPFANPFTLTLVRVE